MLKLRRLMAARFNFEESPERRSVFLGDGRSANVVAAVSGLTDVDAITLSTSQTNLIFKAGTVAALGHRQLLARIASAYAVALAVGLAILVFWPESS
jgi:hypothetical protein